MSQDMYANYGTVKVSPFRAAPVYNRRTCCRLCGSSNLIEVVSLTPTPPANAFVPPELVSTVDTVYPLNISFCNDCYHVQLVDIISSEALFQHYVYVSGTSSVMVEHLRQYAEEALEIAKVCPTTDLVVEFGSNDGTLLRFFQERGVKVLGVDPAENLAVEANKSGVETLCDYFSESIADDIVSRYGKARVICANHVCAHIDNFIGVLKAVKSLLAEDGIWIFEVGYFLDVFSKNLFDTIYHEHVDFHTVLPIRRVLPDYGLQLTWAKQVNIQGGSLRCFVRHSSFEGVSRDHLADIAELERKEAQSGLYSSQTISKWSDQINTIGLELRCLLSGLCNAGKTIVGYGAPAKATTLMYHYGINKEIVKFIVDDNTLKQGLYTPGLHIPVYPVERMYDAEVNYVLILAWNFADAIVQKHARFSATGGRFIIPLPRLHVI